MAILCILEHMKRLYRSETDKKIGGVCGGLAVYFNIDPTVVRIIFVLLLLPGGLPGLLPYLIMWFVLPTESEVRREESSTKEPRKIVQK